LFRASFRRYATPKAAAAICEAAMRPGQRFVPVRSLANQAALMRHRVREQLVGQHMALLNALRGHLSEIGIHLAELWLPTLLAD
jgi:transposase